MADSTLDDKLFILIDNWPGAAVQMYDEPTDGFIGATHHNVAAKAYPIATKVMVYQEAGTTTAAGWSTFLYAQIDITGTPTVAAKQLCVPDAEATGIYMLTNDPDACIDLEGCSFAGVALSAMATDVYYGWFWVGGVCPVGYVAGLDGNYATAADTIAGDLVAHNLAADAIGLGPRATIEGVIGYALSADA